jgi:superfamily II DNA/RNA helicase
MTALPSERPALSRRRPSGGKPWTARPPATFASAGVPASLVTTLAGTGIVTPFPIQAATLPDALAARDILGQGQTGSGKTLAFSIPLAARLAGGFTSACRPRGLVLVPTRELASQVQAVLAPLACAARLTVTAIFGGVRQNPQVAALRNRTDIIIACPGRLADLIKQGHCDLGDVEITVLDEADHMADLGFLPVVRQLLGTTPSDGQRMLFSATLDHAVDVLVQRFMNHPARYTAGPAEAPLAMTHHLLTVTPADRTSVVAAITGGSGRSLVFTRTKRGAHRLACQLTRAGISAGELHGNLTQNARERNLAAFTTGVTRVMVATDIAARGIHVDGIDLVIHADSPAEHKAYLHRAGRTARAGAVGIVITLQTPAQADEVRAMMRKARVVPLAATVTPRSALLRSISGGPISPVKPQARRARMATAVAPPAAGGGAAAFSARFRGHRR